MFLLYTSLCRDMFQKAVRQLTLPGKSWTAYELSSNVTPFVYTKVKGTLFFFFNVLKTHFEKKNNKAQYNIVKVKTRKNGNISRLHFTIWLTLPQVRHSVDILSIKLDVLVVLWIIQLNTLSLSFVTIQ